MKNKNENKEPPQKTNEETRERQNINKKQHTQKSVGGGSALHFRPLLQALFSLTGALLRAQHHMLPLKYTPCHDTTVDAVNGDEHSSGLFGIITQVCTRAERASRASSDVAKRMYSHGTGANSRHARYHIRPARQHDTIKVIEAPREAY